MATTMTVKGQVTIPKRVRDALGLTPGDLVHFDVDPEGRVVIQRAQAGSRARASARRAPDRFEAVRGRADIKWRTSELMALLRGAD